MNRKLVNILLILLALAIVIIIGKDFTGKKAGKNIVNTYEYNVDEFRVVDSTKVLYQEIATFPVPSEELSGIGVAGDKIIVAAGNKLLQFDYAGKELWRRNLSDTAYCIAVDAKKEIWIGTSHSVIHYSPEGDLIKKWNGWDEHSVITSLVVSDKKVFVADAGNRVVYQCDLNGNREAIIGEKNEQKGVPGYVIPSPFFDVALDADGFLWVANTGRHSLENYNADGSLRTSWGKASFRMDGFSGCCNPAEMAILKDNSFITSEKGMPRIKLYDQHGVFKGVVAPPDAFNRESYLAPDITIDEAQRILALDYSRKQVRIFELKAK